MRGFIVEKNTPGFVAKKIEYKNSMRASDTGSLHLNNCKVPESSIFPVYDKKSNGIKSLLQCFNQARFGICCGVVGAAQSCFDEAQEFVLNRGAQGGPLVSKQLIHEKFAIMAAEISDMQLRAREILRLKDENKLSLIIKDTTPAFVNALRRIILDEVPTMAIEDVEFRKNNSILYDEMIAHRLGLLPLKTDLKSYTVPEHCKCEGKGCARSYG